MKCIMQTPPCNLDPFKPPFYVVKFECSSGRLYFSHFCSDWCSSNVYYPYSLFETKIKKISNLFNENCHFFAAEKNAVYSLGVLLAHLSRRLIGELIGYSWSGVRLSSSVIVVRR